MPYLFLIQGAFLVKNQAYFKTINRRGRCWGLTISDQDLVPFERLRPEGASLTKSRVASATGSVCFSSSVITSALNSSNSPRNEVSTSSLRRTSTSVSVSCVSSVCNVPTRDCSPVRSAWSCSWLARNCWLVPVSSSTVCQAWFRSVSVC